MRFLSDLVAWLWCGHRESVREVSPDGRLRLRCVRCWRVSPGVAVAPARYVLTQAADKRRLRLRQLREVRRMGAIQLR